MNTSDRLRSYYSFSEPVIEAIAEVAERQASFANYPDFLKTVGIVDLEPAPILDIKPKDFDPDEAIAVHLSMANPLDSSNIYSLGTLAAMYPERRIVASANPSGIGYSQNKLGASDRRKVAKGDFRPVVSPLGRYLESQGVSVVTQIGSSYGADLVLAMSELDLFNVPDAVIIEPASVVTRGLMKLGSDFKSSDAAFKGYVEANELDAFLQARKDAVSANNYALGLARLTNIAVSRGIARGGFRERLDYFLDQNRTVANIVWGSESELCVDEVITEIVDEMQEEYGDASVRKIRIPGQKHAMVNDLHLYAAIVAESIGLDR